MSMNDPRYANGPRFLVHAHRRERGAQGLSSSRRGFGVELRAATNIRSVASVFTLRRSQVRERRPPRDHSRDPHTPTVNCGPLVPAACFPLTRTRGVATRHTWERYKMSRRPSNNGHDTRYTRDITCIRTNHADTPFLFRMQFRVRDCDNNRSRGNRGRIFAREISSSEARYAKISPDISPSFHRLASSRFAVSSTASRRF